MKIELSKQEYQTLLEMLVLSEWLTGLTDDRDIAHHALKQKLLAYSQAMGATDRVCYDKQTHHFFETEAFKAAMLKQYIDPYDDHVFWKMLADQLAERDLIEQVGADDMTAMTDQDRTQYLEALVEWYDQEFTRHGLQRLSIQGERTHTLH